MWPLILASALALALALAPALAQAEPVDPEAEPVDPEVEPVDPEAALAPARLAELWSQMPPESLLDAALAHRAQGDLQGARERLLVVARSGQLPELSRYQLAASDEIDERYAEALAGYEAVIAAGPDLPLADDARYRRAIVLEDLGRHAEAARQIAELEDRGRWSAQDQQSMVLVRGAAQVRAGLAAGKKGPLRRGIARIEASLAVLEGSTDLPWARARGRLALVEALLQAASEVEIRADRGAKRSLVARAALLDQATDQVIAIANLGEPEPALLGLLYLGDANLALHADLLASPAPPRLSADQLAIYRTELAQQVAVLEVKAWRLYDQGVSLATRLNWQGQVAGQLQARRASVDIDP